MLMAEMVRTSCKQQQTMTFQELELIELNKEKVLAVLLQIGLLSTGEQLLEMAELLMELKKRVMDAQQKLQ